MAQRTAIERERRDEQRGNCPEISNPQGSRHAIASIASAKRPRGAGRPPRDKTLLPALFPKR
jgi:hypothetical protein